MSLLNVSAQNLRWFPQISRIFCGDIRVAGTHPGRAL